MSTSEQTFFRIYESLEERLNFIGEITSAEAWEIAGGGYGTVCKTFKSIMNTMIEQKKAIKIRNGKYKILKPNDP